MNSSFPKVYVVQSPKPNGKGWTPNLEPATQFGALHFIFSAEDRPNLNPTQAVQICSNILKDFRPDTDFLLYPNAGDPAGMWAAVISLCCLGVSHINFLYWERKLGADGQRVPNSGWYQPIKFSIVPQINQGHKGEVNGNKS